LLAKESFSNSCLKTPGKHSRARILSGWGRRGHPLDIPSQTMAEKNKDFPSALQASLLVLALFVAEVIAWAVMHDARGVLSLTENQSGAIAAVLANGCLFAFILDFKGLKYRDVFHPSRIGLRKTLAVLVLPVLMLIPALVLVDSAIGSALERVVPMSSSEGAMFARMNAAEGLAALLIVCVIAPVVEEMLFRGIILRGFLHQYGRWQSIWGSAALFGVAHLNIYQFAVALLTGVVSGWLYERSRSLLPCIALHAAFNTAVVTLARSHMEDSIPIHASASPSVWIGSLALAAASSAFLFLILRRVRFDG
jgi:membrane protease YdiL (CAAX protease family)